MEDGRWQEAAEIYRRGIGIAGEGGSYMHLHELYLGLSEALCGMGDIRGGLENFRRYHYLSDSVFNLEKERAMNEMMVKYGTEKKERLLPQQEVELVKKNRRLVVSAFAIVLLTVTAVAVTVLYIRRKEMYRQLARRHYENYKLEQKLKSSDAARSEVGQASEHSAHENMSQATVRQNILYNGAGQTVPGQELECRDTCQYPAHQPNIRVVRHQSICRDDIQELCQLIEDIGGGGDTFRPGQ